MRPATHAPRSLPLMMLLVACASHTSASESVSGYIRVLADDVNGPVILLDTANNGVLQLEFADDAYAADLGPGLEVTVTSDKIDFSSKKINVASLKALLPGGSDHPGTRHLSTWGGGPEFVFKSITYIVSVCGKTVHTDAGAVRDFYFSEKAKYSMKGYFETCSFGALTMPEEDNVVVGPITIPCEGVSSRGFSYRSDQCSWQDNFGWYDAARDEAIRLGYDPSLYKHQIMIIPELSDIPCYWGGISDTGCPFAECLSIIKGTGVQEYGSLPHELGHSLYLEHANWQGKESRDTTSSMSSHCCEPACYNTPQSFSLGWTSPVTEYNQENLQVGHWISAEIPEWLSTSKNFIMIKPDWRPDGGYPYVTLSYKVAEGYNKGINPNSMDFGSHLHMHVHNASDWQAGTYSLAIKSNLIANIDVGERFSDHDSDITVQLKSLNSERAVVSFCRASSATETNCNDGIDEDCDGIIDADDTDCGGPGYETKPRFPPPPSPTPPSSPSPSPSPSRRMLRGAHTVDLEVAPHEDEVEE